MGNHWLFFILSVFHSSNLCDDLQVRWLHTFNLDICVLATMLLFLHSCPPPLSAAHSVCVTVWVLRGPIVSACSPGAHSAVAGQRSLQSSPHRSGSPCGGTQTPPVPWASCRGGHSPIILPSKVATWQSVSDQARWLCAVLKRSGFFVDRREWYCFSWPDVWQWPECCLEIPYFTF